MNKLLLVCLLTLTLPLCVQAQGKQVLDSLEYIVKTSKDGTQRVRSYTELATLHRTDSVTAFAYCDSAWQLAGSLQADKAGMQCYVACIRAGFYRFYNDTVRSVKYIDVAARLAKQAGDPVYMGLVYHQQALGEYLKNNYDKAIRLFLQSIDRLENTGYNDICVIQYYVLSNIFERFADYESCVRYAKGSVRHAKTLNDQCRAKHALGSAYFHMANNDTAKNSIYLDSCLVLMYQAKRIVEHHRDRIREPILPLRVYNDMANLYMYIESKQDTDSAKHYLRLARSASLDIGNRLGYATMTVLLASYDVEDNKLASAGKLMGEAMRAYAEAYPKDVSVEANISMGFALLYKKTGEFRKALEAYRRFSELRDSVHHIEALEGVKSTEARFLKEKKERQIEILKEEETGRQRTTWFSFGFATIALSSVVMLYRTTRFRKKYHQEKEKALEQQAENTQLKQEEAEHVLILQRKESEQLALQHQLGLKQKNQYLRELNAGVKHLEAQHELLLRLKERIAAMSPDKQVDQRKAVVSQVLELIDQNLAIDDRFKRFEENLEHVYPHFFKTLRQRATDNLSQLDLRQCAYVYIGLSTKEISNLLDIDPASIRTARYRLKQKFNLAREEDLVSFINTCLSV